MGTIRYNVKIKLVFKSKEDKVKATEILRKEIKTHDAKYWVRDPNNYLETFQDCLGVYLAEKQGSFKFNEEDGVEIYTSNFDATYNWIEELSKMKALIEPYLAKGRFSFFD